MKHVVSHDLGQEKAKKVAEAAFAAYTERFQQYNPTATWKSDRLAEIAFTVKGMQLKGSMEVNDRDIAMDLDVPFLLRPFKGTALGVIEREIQTWMTKAKAGEL